MIRKWQQRSAIKISVFKTFQVRVAKKLCDSTEARPPKKVGTERLEEENRNYLNALHSDIDGKS